MHRRVLLFEVLVAGWVASACARAQVLDTPAPAPAPGDKIRFSARPDSTTFIVARTVRLDAESLVFERYVPGLVGHPGEWVTDQIPTDSLARLQVWVRRHGNAGSGALIGAGVGVVLGLVCSSSSDEWLAPSPGECLVSGALSGAAFGALIGAFVKGDVWAPASLPERPPPESVSTLR